MWSELVARHWGSLHGLVTIVALGIYLTASHSLRQRRHPSAAIAWFLSLALIPYLALPLYLLIGNRKVVRPLHAPRSQTSLPTNPEVSPTESRFQILAGTLGLPPPSTYDHFELHENGSHARQALISVIESATATLDVCTFVLGRDVLGQEITQKLMQCAKKGVRVRLMIDGLGRYLDGHPDLRSLKTAGVRVALFVSPLKSPFPGRTNLRNHRKMVIADGARTWMGGRNLAAEYFEGDSSLRRQKTPWIDLSFELSGAIARQTQDQFNQDWAFATQERRMATSPPSPSGPAIESPSVQLLPSGPDQTEDTVYTLLISSCFAAQTRILAVSPYFVPDATLQMALTLAARRGITVDLLLPRKSNHRLADMARHAALRELSASGARVWLAPDMIHAKAIVIDDEIALAGSANLDERSLFLNYEVMVAFYKQVDVQRLAQWIELRREGAQLYKARAPGVLRELGEGVVRWLAFQL
jgi:cardiolipin synthase A/B